MKARRGLPPPPRAERNPLAVKIAELFDTYNTLLGQSEQQAKEIAELMARPRVAPLPVSWTGQIKVFGLVVLALVVTPVYPGKANS